MIELDVIQKNQNLFQSFIQHLLSVISNLSLNRLLRQSCCECLYELESVYPALLSNYVFQILRLCQNESSHILQSYSTLLMIALEHWVQKSLVQYSQQQLQWEKGSASSASSRMSSSSSSGRMTSTANQSDISKFTIPLFLLQYASPIASSNVTVPYILPDCKKELHQSISFIVENVSLFTVWGEAAILEHLLSFIQFTEFPLHVIRNCFKGCVFGMNPLQVHSAVQLYKRLSSASDPSEELALLQKISWMPRDYSIPSHFRSIAVEWILSLSKTNPYLIQHYKEYYPMIFDDLLLKEAKLKCLIGCYTPQNRSSLQLGKTDNLLAALICLNDYFYFKEFRGQNKRVDIIFDFLFRLLQKNPLYYENIYNYMSRMIDQELDAQKHNSKIQSFILENVIHFIDKYEEYARSMEDPEQYFAIAKTFLTSLENRLCRFSNHTHSIRYYFPLIQRIAEDPFIEPHNLLNYLYDYMRQKDICEEGDWVTGDEMLKTCRLAMVSFNLRNSESTGTPLMNLLYLLCTKFENVDIRDRATLYYKLFRNLPGEKLSFILQDIMSLDENERAAQYRDTMKLLKLRMSSTKTATHIHKVQPFLHLERLYSEEGIKIQPATTQTDPSNEELEDITKLYYVNIRKQKKLLKSQKEQTGTDNQENSLLISLQYKLRYATQEEIKRQILVMQNVEGIEELGDDKFTNTKVYGLKLDFANNKNQQLTHLKPVRIPFLQNDASVSHHEHIFRLSFYPTRPLPVVFNVTAQYTASNSSNGDRPKSQQFKPEIDSGVLCSTQLNNVSVTFQDLFMPLPISTTLRQKYPKYCIENILFELMWTKKSQTILNDLMTHKKRVGNRRKKLVQKKNAPMANEWTESVLVVEGKCDIRSKYPALLPFLLPPSFDRAIVFLPPQYHLLLSFHTATASDQNQVVTHIKMKTDYLLTLSFVESVFTSR